MSNWAIRRRDEEQVLFMDEILSALDGDGVILDAGCGDWSFDYQSFGFKIMAIDRGTSSKHSLLPPNAGFAKADVSGLPFPGEVFDAILFNWVLEHVNDPAACLAEARRTLKRDGLLYVSIPNGFGVEDRLYRLAFNGGGHVQRFSFQSFCRLAYAAGFRLNSFAEWPSGYTWTRGMPRFRRALLTALHWANRRLGYSFSRNANWIMTFEKCDRHGFRLVTNTCAHCGGGVNIDAPVSGPSWTCPICNGTNLFI